MPSADAASPRASNSIGSFSVSLSVKDLAASRKFYEQLGFTAGHGDMAQNWIVLRNGDTVIGLFEGMFEGNMLTFNPGWSQQAEPLPTFTDVRVLQQQLEGKGLEPVVRAEAGDGPAFLMLRDPDGNMLLIDQHVPAPHAAAAQ
ncbi:MAG: VOC family protein [Planctomycetes bacterium]|nr:VOC family protein [Planctomycetota bacterium]